MARHSMAKRQLPILNQKMAPPVGSLPEPETERPAWQWVPIGLVLTYLMWVPLASVTVRLGQWLLPAIYPDPSARSAGVAVVIVGLLQAAVLMICCGATGYVIGAHGGQAGRREALATGALAGALPVLLLAVLPVGGGPSQMLISLLPVVALGALSSWAGGVVGLRRRPR
jgi:tRNA-(ms[2]io[6]A)-hydroxylase